MEKIKLSYLHWYVTFPLFCFVFFPRSLQREELIEYGQFKLSEHHRLMREACQFTQFKKKPAWKVDSGLTP